MLPPNASPRNGGRRCLRSPRPPTWSSLRAAASRLAARRDFDAVMSFYAPDAVWDGSHRGHGDVRGRGGDSGFFEDWFGAYEEFEIEMEEILDLGNGVVVRRATRQALGLLAAAGSVRERGAYRRRVGGRPDRARDDRTPTSTRPVLPPNASPRNGGRRCRRRTWRIMRAVYDAWNAGDRDAVAEHVAPGGVRGASRALAGVTGVYRGVDAVPSPLARHAWCLGGLLRSTPSEIDRPRRQARRV